MLHTIEAVGRPGMRNVQGNAHDGHVVRADEAKSSDFPFYACTQTSAERPGSFTQARRRAVRGYFFG